MEFKLEDFDDQQEPVFNFGDKNENENTFREKDKKYPNKRKRKNLLKNFSLSYLKNYIFYKFILLPILLLLIAFIAPKLFQQAAKNYLEKARSSPQATINAKQEKIFPQQNTPSYKPTYSYQSESKKSPEKKLAQSGKKGKGQALYSWVNEDGSKAFSNIGFPADGNYKDGKIEWY
jgi:Tfp pilus assembly protein PilP